MITINSDKFKSFLTIYDKNDNNPILKMQKAYRNYIDCNIFSDLICPCCQKEGYLKYHKDYNRFLVYCDNEVLSTIDISIAVVKCEYCEKNNYKQKYHALLPDFILPYHSHEASVIIKSIYDRLIKKIKLEEILERLQIKHKLFYDWIKKFTKYLLPSSIILKMNNQVNDIIKQIYEQNQIFLNEFFLNYKHPYFLFKSTCVPLCINH